MARNGIKVGDKVEVVNDDWTVFYSQGSQGEVIAINPDDTSKEGLTCTVRFCVGYYDRACNGEWMVHLENLKKIKGYRK